MSRTPGAFPLQVAAIDFLNTAPLIWGLDREPRLALAYTLPSACADALRAGTADIGIIPVIEMARIPGLMAIPCIAIAAGDEVRSILLISRCAPAQIRTLALDLSSRTSSALVQVLLRGRYGCVPEVRETVPDWRRMLSEADAALVIGDRALKLSVSGEAQAAGCEVRDLAREWFDWTGLPFVFALWAVRQDALLAPATAEWLVERCLAARSEGLAHLEEIVAHWSGRLALPEAEVRQYLRRDVQYQLTAAHGAALARFFELAAAAGLIPSTCLPSFLPQPEAIRTPA